MKIKTKLLLNVAIIAAIILSLSSTSYVSMRFIKQKLTALTEKSTPFQVRTLEFQRAIQGITTDLVKIGAAGDRNEFDNYVTEAGRSLAEAGTAQQELEALSGERYTTVSDLSAIRESLCRAVESRLTADEDAARASKTVQARLNDTLHLLRNLDAEVKTMQAASAGSYAAAVKDRAILADQLTSLEMARSQLRGIMAALLQFQRNGAKRYLNEARSASKRLLQNGDVKRNPKFMGEAKNLAAEIEEYFRAKAANAPARSEALLNDISEKTDGFYAGLEDILEDMYERSDATLKRQETSSRKSALAFNALESNSELVANGIALDGIVSRMLTADSTAAVDSALRIVQDQFGKIRTSEGAVGNQLTKIQATQELALLKKAGASLDGIRTAVTAPDGVASAIRRKIDAHDAVVRETDRLKEIVLLQARKGKQTVVAARGEQEKAIGAVNGMINNSLTMIMVIGAIAILLGFGFGYWIYRAIAIPLAHLICSAGEISSGNLNCTIETGRSDEIGLVQRAMAEMVASLRTIAERIGGATSSMASGSEELSSTAVTLEHGTVDQTARIEHSAVAISQMSQTINDVARNAHQTAGTAETTKGTAADSKKMMHHAMEELNRFAETMKSSVRQVETLGEKSREITSIVDLINDIADQTNLLALNAAIEAARAGDAGHGFAVVANEVRTLSEKSGAATGEITQRVNDMRERIDGTVTLIMDESSAIDRVVEIVNGSLSSIDRIVADIEGIADMVARIATATVEQSATADEITGNINEIANVARQIRSAFSDVMRSSQDLAHTAVDLNETARWFRLGA